MWHCTCDCGNELVVRASSLRCGNTCSCGCLQRDRSAAAALIHGGVGTPTYAVWSKIIERCYNPRTHLYSFYGGRGIRMSHRWRESYAAFRSDMGERPSSAHSIDRINNDGDYEVGNCRWATRAQQARNTSRNIIITHNGESLCMTDWAKRIGVSPGTIAYRLRVGLPIESVLYSGHRQMAPKC